MVVSALRRKAALLVKRRFGQANHGGRTRIETSEAELVSNSYLSSSQHGNNVAVCDRSPAEIVFVKWMTRFDIWRQAIADNRFRAFCAGSDYLRHSGPWSEKRPARRSLDSGVTPANHFAVKRFAASGNKPAPALVFHAYAAD